MDDTPIALVAVLRAQLGAAPLKRGPLTVYSSLSILSQRVKTK
jgi:hypothetical protein